MITVLCVEAETRDGASPFFHHFISSTMKDLQVPTQESQTIAVQMTKKEYALFEYLFDGGAEDVREKAIQLNRCNDLIFRPQLPNQIEIQGDELEGLRIQRFIISSMMDISREKN
jgi:hypothetical protein